MDRGAGHRFRYLSHAMYTLCHCDWTVAEPNMTSLLSGLFIHPSSFCFTSVPLGAHDLKATQGTPSRHSLYRVTHWQPSINVRWWTILEIWVSTIDCSLRKVAVVAYEIYCDCIWVTVRYRNGQFASDKPSRIDVKRWQRWRHLLIERDCFSF